MTFLHCLAILSSAFMAHLSWQTRIELPGLKKDGKVFFALNDLTAESVLLFILLAMKFGLAIFFASLTLYLITN